MTMKKTIIISLLLAGCSCWGAPDVILKNPKTVTWTLSGGQYFARYGSVTPPGPYAWDTAYTNSVLLWEFANTNNPTADTSYIGTNSGTLGAGAAQPTWVAATGGVSAAFYFDGGDLIKRPQIQSLTGTGNKSATFWAIGTNSATALSFGNSGTDGGLWQITADSGKIYFQVQNGNRAFTTATRVSGVFYHYAVGHVSANTTGSWAYLDGKALPVSSTAARAINTISGTNFVGRAFNAAGPSYWTGRIDEPRVYTRALTAAEVATNFWTTATNHGWTKWDFDNRNGLYLNQALACSFNYAAAADQSTNRNHGTVSGATQIYPNNNGARTFDGINDTITYTVAQTKNAYTLWAATNVTWRHYAELGGTQYVDAVVASFTNKFWFTSGNTVTLGKNAGTYGGFDGDNFRIFTALTPAQLTALKNAGRQ